MKRKIQDSGFRYRLLRTYVRFAIFLYYGKIQVIGRENIPHGKSVIFAPNHQNALMDALLVLYAYQPRVVFLARGDIFRKKAIARILRFFKILPVFRIRDGRGELDKNYEIFEQSVSVLRDGVTLCLMPEGQQSMKRQLLPLVKGMFRIAFQAQQALPGREVVIVPIGIDYTNYVDSGANVVIRFGKPLSVKDYLPIYEESQGKGLNELKDIVSANMKKQIHDIRSEKHYDCFYQLSVVLAQKIAQEENAKTPDSMLAIRQRVSQKLDSMAIEKPEYAETIQKRYAALEQGFNRLGVQMEDAVLPPSRKQIFRQIICLTIGAPAFVAGWVANAIPAYAPRLIINKMKSDQFKSSVHFALWLILYLLYYIIVWVAIGCLFSWLMACISVVLMFSLGLFAYHYNKQLIRLKDRITYLRLLKS